MKSSFLMLASGILMLLGLNACNLNQVDSSQAAYDEDLKKIDAYATAQKLAGKQTASGLYFAITKSVPSSKKPSLGEEVMFTYKLSLLNGTVVDSTAKPAFYPFGLGALLPGLEEGLSLIGEGETAVLLLPSALAYGTQGNSKVPANSVVRFDVQLVRSRTEDQQIDDYIIEKGYKLTNRSTTGLRIIKTLDNPTGAALATNQTVTVKYAGRTFRSSSDFDAGTLSMILGLRQVVSGFEEGVGQLRVGEKATIIFPSSLGYGSQGRANNGVYVIAPYAPLAFDIEIVSAK
nr:FKBP-type peptidyl-prolyl cis-trans isomerase [uncultured Arsenicibacter sp.]